MDYIQEIKAFSATHPLEEKEVGDALFHYRLSGSGGDTFVLLTGGTGYTEGFYRHVLAFEKHAKVLLPEYPLALCDNNSLADGIVALVKSLGLGSPVLIGQSYGGMLAQVMAKRHPDDVKGMVLSNTGTITESTKADEGMQAMLARQKASLELLAAKPYEEIKKMMLSQLSVYLTSLAQEQRRFVEQMFQDMAECITLERNLLMTGLLLDFLAYPCFVQKDFAALKGRVLLLLSQDDHTFSDGVKEALISIMPEPRVDRTLSGGHLAMTLHIDRYVETVLQFTQSLT